jgi:ribosome-associated translation inhibitor RaiA
MSVDLVDRVHFGGGFTERDRGLVADTLAQALGRFAHLDQSWQMELSVKDREAPGQNVTLEAWVPGKQRLVATSALADLRAALNDVGDDLRRQLNKAREIGSPQSNRAKRETIRGH